MVHCLDGESVNKDAFSGKMNLLSFMGAKIYDKKQALLHFHFPTTDC